MDLAGFSEKLKAAKPGDKVKVGVARASGETVVVEVLLKARSGGA